LLLTISASAIAPLDRRHDQQVQQRFLMLM
jgi:hypothetical protein